MSKKFWGILILSLSILLLVTTNVSASELEKSEVSDLFTNFIDRAFENPRNITAIDSSGSDVTKEFINVTSDYYHSQDYKAIQNYINDNNLEVSITKTKDLNVIQKDYSINSDIRSRNVSKEFYASGKAANGRTAEWTITIRGNYSYNASTYRVTHVTKPTVSLTQTNFGANMSPYMTGVASSSSYSGSYATFTGKYTMMADQTHAFVTITHNFGSKTHTFKSHPLQ